MFVIKQAKHKELNKVRHFYYSLIDKMQNVKYSPEWKKDVYPDEMLLRESIKKRELYIGELDGIVVAVMIVNHHSNEGYQNIYWPTEAELKEVYVIHALGVHPDYSGRGFAKTMVQEAFLLGKHNGIKAIRLNVLKGNIPAEKLYVGIGFQYIDTVPMYYEDTGWKDFKLYEYIL